MGCIWSKTALAVFIAIAKAIALQFHTLAVLIWVGVALATTSWLKPLPHLTLG